MKKREPYLLIKEGPGLKILVSPSPGKHLYESRAIKKSNNKDAVKAVLISAIFALVIIIGPIAFDYLIYSIH